MYVDLMISTFLTPNLFPFNYTFKIFNYSKLNAEYMTSLYVVAYNTIKGRVIHILS